MSDYFNQEALLQYPSFQPLPVYGVLNRSLQENDVIFARTPSVILNSTDGFRQWNFENSPSWNVVESSRQTAPYYANITLPFNQTPQRRRRRDDNGYDVDESSIQKRQIGDDGRHTFVDIFISLKIQGTGTCMN